MDVNPAIGWSNYRNPFFLSHQIIPETLNSKNMLWLFGGMYEISFMVLVHFLVDKSPHSILQYA